MLFVDPFFLFAFLPVALVAFYGAARYFGREAGLATLIAASIVFYVKFGLFYFLILFLSVLVNFVVGIYLISGGDFRWRQAILVIGQTFNFGTLIFFKYLPPLLGAQQHDIVGPAGLWASAIPVGISFYTFHQAIFLMDAAARKPIVLDYLSFGRSAQEITRAFLRYASFIFFFPQLIIGPIVYLAEFAPNVMSGTFGKSKRSDVDVGIALLLFGLFKKIVFADHLALSTAPLFASLQSGAVPSASTAWAVACAYFLQLYFDFSGYTDMAIGIARLFGVRLPINFDSPLRASGISDFYRRWHITLTRAIARFLFTPLSLWGARTSADHELRGAASRFFVSWLPLFLNFEVIALWHAARLTFVLFGAIHGSWFILETEMKRTRWWRSWRDRVSPAVLRRWGQACTFLPLMLTFSLFGSPSLIAFGRLLSGMAFVGIDQAPSPYLSHRLMALIAIGFVVVWLLPNSNEILRRYRAGIRTWNNPSTTPSAFAFVWRPNIVWFSFMALIAVADIWSLGYKTAFLYMGY